MWLLSNAKILFLQGDATDMQKKYLPSLQINTNDQCELSFFIQDCSNEFLCEWK